MKFDKETYINEMKAMVNKAVERMRTEKPAFEIYTASIWTDANAGISAVSFDSKINSDRKTAEADERWKKYLEEFGDENDLEQAKLSEAVIVRNCNPADFELRGFKGYGANS